MITWLEACQSVNFNPKIIAPEIKYKWFSYKDGKSIEFDNEKEAKLHSSLIEKVVIQESQESIDQFNNAYNSLNIDAYNAWLSELTKEYSYLRLDIFNLCYEQACQDAFDDGLDAIASHMAGIVDFTTRMLAIVNARPLT